jgi:hypothetical protein
MAQAQVVLTAVDKTQGAINSALRGMKTLERTAKVTSKAINLAFGLLTGTVLIGAFRNITEAAKKTEEGRAALDKFNRALKDPALVSAANSFTTTLIKGFSAVVEVATVAVKKFNEVGQSLGFLEAPREGGASRGPSRRYRPGSIKVDEMTQMLHYHKQQMNRMKAEAEAQKEIEKQAKAARDAMLTKQAAENQRFQDMKENLTDLDFSLVKVIDTSTIGISKSVSDLLDDVNAKEEVFRNFAQSAAQSMQSAFADFLFDPFENGLKGMLSAFLNVIRRMVAEAASVAILKAIFGGIDTGGGGPFATFVKALTGRASGGPVSSGTPYIVGERGPELFVPNGSGNIVPNNKMGGVTVAPVYNIDARGATADLQQALPGILKENNRRIFDELDRRYGIGR